MRRKGFTLIELLIVVAIIAILAAIAIPNFLEAQIRSKVARVKADVRSLSTAIESYYIDNNTYPATDSSDMNTGFGVDAGNPNLRPELAKMPVFRVKQNREDRLNTITTPIAYIQTVFPDPFASSNGASFRYSTPSFGLAQTAGWITWSFGPDLDQEIPSDGGMWELSGGDIKFGPVGQPNPRVETDFYNPNERVPSSTLTQVTYDPSNGSTSSGDVWRTKN